MVAKSEYVAFLFRGLYLPVPNICFRACPVNSAKDGLSRYGSGLRKNDKWVRIAEIQNLSNYNFGVISWKPEM